MHSRPGVIAVILLFSCHILTGQQNIDTAQDFTLDAFKGMVYSMPIEEHDIDPAFIRSVQERGGLMKDGRYVSRKIADRYSHRVLGYPQIGEITLERLNIPETTSAREAFPDIGRSGSFCMLLNSTLTIARQGCYEFSLNSDDGSVLWIDNVEVVNNDGGHGMRLVRDSVSLAEGAYTVRLWYFQSVFRVGLQLNIDRVGDMSACDTLARIQQYVLNSTLLFSTGAFTLTDSAETRLSALLTPLAGQDIRSIEITGHTDNVGSHESNHILSQKRADSIAEYCARFFQDTEIQIIATGMGETQPRAGNDTEAGREENRRVEINVIVKGGR